MGNFQLKNKFNNLKKDIRSMGAFVLAYSGGVDSAFLLKVGYDVLGENALAITARSEIHPEAESREASVLAKSIGVKHKVIKTNELDDYNFISNPLDRCYFCKKGLFAKLAGIAKKKI